MVTIDRLDSENVSAYYDMEAQIAFITYRNEVNPRPICESTSN